MPGTHVFINANKSIANSGTPTFNWDGENVDELGAWDAGAASRLTVLLSGWYAVVVATRWATSTSGTRHIDIRKNGSTVYAGDMQLLPSTALGTRTMAVYMGYFAANDYIEAIATNTASGAQNIAQGDWGLVKL